MHIKSMYTFLADFFFTLIYEKDILIRKIEKMRLETFKSECAASYSSIAPFSYKDPLARSVVWNMKYRKNRKCLILAANILHEEIIKKIKSISNENTPLPFLIPVPLSSKRKKERGYNQTEELARELRKIDNDRNFIVRTDIVFKKVHTEQQTKLTRKERVHNLTDAFGIHDSFLIKNKNIILLDDVFTTGATMNEVTKLLKRYGAQTVLPIAFAQS